MLASLTCEGRLGAWSWTSRVLIRRTTELTEEARKTVFLYAEEGRFSLLAHHEARQDQECLTLTKPNAPCRLPPARPRPEALDRHQKADGRRPATIMIGAPELSTLSSAETNLLANTLCGYGLEPSPRHRPQDSGCLQPGCPILVVTPKREWTSASCRVFRVPPRLRRRTFWACSKLDEDPETGFDALASWVYRLPRSGLPADDARESREGLPHNVVPIQAYSSVNVDPRLAMYAAPRTP